MDQTVKYNDRLFKAFQASATAKTVSKYLLGRERAARRTHIPSFKWELKKAGYDISEAELIGLFRDLEAIEIGKLEMGPRGMPKFFHWNYKFTSVIEAATGKSKPVPFRHRSEPMPVYKAVETKALPVVAMSKMTQYTSSSIRAKLSFDGTEIELTAEPEMLARVINSLTKKEAG